MLWAYLFLIHRSVLKATSKCSLTKICTKAVLAYCKFAWIHRDDAICIYVDFFTMLVSPAVGMFPLNGPSLVNRALVFAVMLFDLFEVFAALGLGDYFMPFPLLTDF